MSYDDDQEIGWYEFCPLMTGAFGPWFHRGRGRLMSRKRAVRLFKRWKRRFGNGALYVTPVHQDSLIIKAVESENISL